MWHASLLGMICAALASPTVTALTAKKNSFDQRQQDGDLLVLHRKSHAEARNARVSPGKDGEEGPKGEDQQFRRTKETYGGTAASARRLFLSKAE